MICKKCGNEIDPKKKFCRFCGSRITTDKKFCRFCGHEIDSQAKICRFCGKELVYGDDSDTQNKAITSIVEELGSQREKQQSHEFKVNEEEPQITSGGNKGGVLDNKIGSESIAIQSIYKKYKKKIFIFLFVFAILFSVILIFKKVSTESLNSKISIPATSNNNETEQRINDIPHQATFSPVKATNTTNQEIDDSASPINSGGDGEIIRIMDYCSIYNKSPIYATPNDEIVIYDGWLAKNKDLVQDHIDNVILDIRFDGEQILLDECSGIIPDYDDANNIEGYDVFYEKNIGTLPPGTYLIEAYVTWKMKIFDGWEYYGPGTSNPYIEGYCKIIIE